MTKSLISFALYLVTLGAYMLLCLINAQADIKAVAILISLFILGSDIVILSLGVTA